MTIVGYAIRNQQYQLNIISILQIIYLNYAIVVVIPAKLVEQILKVTALNVRVVVIIILTHIN